MRERIRLLLLAGAALLLACGAARSASAVGPGHGSDRQSQQQGGRVMAFTLSTTAFADGGAIPIRYTCDAADLSPALSWKDVPQGARTLALIADDPDAQAGTWTHWILWNIPPRASFLPEGMPPVETLDNGTRQGRNDFRRLGYGGPCPPPGKPHRYFFKLYALNARLDLKPGAARGELEEAMKGHIVAQAVWMGTCKR